MKIVIVDDNIEKTSEFYKLYEFWNELLNFEKRCKKITVYTNLVAQTTCIVSMPIFRRLDFVDIKNDLMYLSKTLENGDGSTIFILPYENYYLAYCGYINHLIEDLQTVKASMAIKAVYSVELGEG